MTNKYSISYEIKKYPSLAEIEIYNDEINIKISINIKKKIFMLLGSFVKLSKMFVNIKIISV